MKNIRYYLRRYPNRIKYGLIVIDLIAMMIAIRVYVNYLSIETTIEDTIVQRETKMAELTFTQNFLVHYEKSDFARYFLQHENNMLMPGEYVIKLVENSKKVSTGAQDTTTVQNNTDPNLIISPQA
jgi:hypothetical protein